MISFLRRAMSARSAFASVRRRATLADAAAVARLASAEGSAEAPLVFGLTLAKAADVDFGFAVARCAEGTGMGAPIVCNLYRRATA